MQKINFQNLPSTLTPINATNLNAMQTNVEDVFNGNDVAGNMVVSGIRTKNIFDKDAIITPGYFDNSGNLVTTDATLSCGSVFIPVKPSTTYTISSSSSTVYRIAYYNSSKTFISRIYNDNASYNYSFTTPSNCYYIRMAGTLTSVLNSLQIEEGSSATTYTPYQELDNQEIYTTGEQVIGTWIDGKPLYRKVLVFTTTSDTYTFTTQSSGISNVENSFIVGGFIKDGDICTPINSARIHTNTIYNNDYSWFRANGSVINYEVASSQAGKTAYIIIEYTKTTD